MRARAGVVALLVGVAGCGGDDNEANERRAGEADLVTCLEGQGLRVTDEGEFDQTEGRDPKVPVPAEHVGVAVTPTGARYELWLADDRRAAQRTETLINRAWRAETGAPRGGAAIEQGRAVVLISHPDSEKPFDLSSLPTVGGCVDALELGA